MYIDRDHWHGVLIDLSSRMGSAVNSLRSGVSASNGQLDGYGSMDIWRRRLASQSISDVDDVYV